MERINGSTGVNRWRRAWLLALTPLVVVPWVLLCAFRAAPQPPDAEKQPTAIRLNVNLVVFPFTVTDSHGRNVGGLSQQAFELLVDGVPEPISVFYGEDAPVTAGIILDNSASMAPKQSEVVASAVAFARGSNPADQMFVVHFNDHARLGLPPGVPYTGDIAVLQTAISQFQLGGTTALYDALLFAQSQLRSALYRLKALLVITDGADNASKATVADVLDRARSTGVLIYPIGIFDERERERGVPVLTRLAKETGGLAFFPTEITEATKLCETIAKEIRMQYTIGFRGAEDGQFHSVELNVKDSRFGPLSVHARPGYLAAKP